MPTEIQPIKKERGHRKESVIRNQALIALHICGFNSYQISDLLKMDRRNAHRFIRKYYPKYVSLILDSISKHFLSYKNYIK